MKCPYCGSEDVKVMNSAGKINAQRYFSKKLMAYLKDEKDYTLRRIKCFECDDTYITLEKYLGARSVDGIGE